MPIFGTRPDAIKMCPLVLELKKREEFKTVVCVTGQHRQMLHSVLDLYRVKPDYDLDIMREAQTIETITSDVLEKLAPVLQKEKPDIVLVHGDTTTAFASALSAFYHKIPVGHVEAGLRSYDIYSPYPEEMNRKLISALTNIFFIPTELCREQLRRENITENVYVTGNTEIDAVKKYTVRADYDIKSIIPDYDENWRLIFVTAHRRENLGAPLENICMALKTIAQKHRDVMIVYPVHLNPAVRNTVFPLLSDCERIKLIDPIGPMDAHNIIAKSELLLTDSGGIQEDAAALSIPCVVLRRETERPEGIECGVAVLGGTDKDRIVKITDTLLNDKKAYEKMANAKNPYGDGNSSKYIADALTEYFTKNVGGNKK
ncbi:MAG: UDP-N-acetylglucosamine 2-epimerase (non-hydrolyzing) [Clostridia bacterium]|nr:UDP-N-acetylglucosamine 2-epimerase (non-hydrolyzing) [Clostridia bacterium]